MSPVIRLGFVTGAGLGIVGLGAVLDPPRTTFAYATAFVYCLTIAWGALALVMIHHATRSSWFVAIRRVAEWTFAPLLVLAVLFLPIALAMETLFPWTRPETLPLHLQHALEKKAAYLNEPFFLLRAALYFVVWVGTALLLAGWSRAQDDGDEGSLALRQQRLSVAALPAFGLSIHFASTDWIMSLEPGWSSSAFGVQVFAGGMVASLALLVVLCALLERGGPLRGVVRTSHFHALGKLLHTLVIFWAYIAYFQYMLIWIADTPREVTWFVTRTEGRWGLVALLLVVGYFGLPFVALLFRNLKRNPARLAVVAGWLLAIHYVEVYWLVMPAHAPSEWRPHYADVGALLLVAGAALLFGCWGARRAAGAARGDPRFSRSLRFETS